MIATVTGRVTALAPDAAVIEVGGIGLSVQCAPGTLARLRVGEPAHLATSLVVREDALTLFGFVDDDERAVFEVLQTVSGVGPRLAQTILGVHDPQTLRSAVASEDLATLTRVPGIGRKGAQRIVLELKDRLGSAAPAEPVPRPRVGSSTPGWREQLHAALLGLGWSAREAEEALGAVASEAEAAAADGQPPNVPALLRSALRALDRS